VASRSLALLTDTDTSSRDDVVARDESSWCGAAGVGAELSRLKWCAHTWSDRSGTALDDGLHAARAVKAAAAMALHEVARAIGLNYCTQNIKFCIYKVALIPLIRKKTTKTQLAILYLASPPPLSFGGDGKRFSAYGPPVIDIAIASHRLPSPLAFLAVGSVVVSRRNSPQVL
jgi:hypothetical protein